MNVNDVKNVVKKRINSYRAIERLLESVDFDLNDEEVKAIELGDLEQIKKLLKSKLDITEYSVSELRKLAIGLGIANCTQYPKLQLTMLITKARKKT